MRYNQGYFPRHRVAPRKRHSTEICRTGTKRISSGLLYKVLRARHSPVRVLNFAFLVEGIPSNTATHFCRHVHAVPFVNSLRNRAAAKTREVAKMMCNEAIKAMPELNGLLEPMCVYHGGVCHKIEGCGRCIHG